MSENSSVGKKLHSHATKNHKWNDRRIEIMSVIFEGVLKIFDLIKVLIFIIWNY